MFLLRRRLKKCSEEAAGTRLSLLLLTGLWYEIDWFSITRGTDDWHWLLLIIHFWRAAQCLLRGLGVLTQDKSALTTLIWSQTLYPSAFHRYYLPLFFSGCHVFFISSFWDHLTRAILLFGELVVHVLVTLRLLASPILTNCSSLELWDCPEK